MQKTTFAGGCVAAAVMFSIVLAPAAIAQGSGGVTTAELGVERPGLLPTNPFYFMKEWARGVRRKFTTGAVNKAEYELQVSTEKAAELKRLEEVKSDARAIARAAENYAENMQRLTERLKTISARSENPKVDKLMDSLVERTLVHQQLLGELKAKYGEVKDDIEAVQKTVDEVLKEVPRTIDSAEQFTDRLKEAIDARRARAVKELGVKAPTSVQQLLERANANIEQAKTFYAAGQFGAAFGQATAAVSAVKNALTQLAVRTQDFEKNIFELKQKFDELRAMARKAELSREKHPKIFALFDQAEQAIVSLSTLSSTAPTSEKFVALMRETKALLGTIEAAIREALMPQIPTAKPVQPEPAVVPTVRNFEECAKASNPVLASDSVSASFPRQCKTKDGRVFKEETACIQVIQPAKDPQSGACKEFPTPCDLPLGWTAVNACPVPEAVKGPEASGTPGTGTSVVPSTWTISMGDDGFFPSELKVRRVDKVVWTNKGSRDHWPASAIHPTHELYPEFDAKRGIGPSESYSFVFENAGTWKYHDHLNSGLTGVIVVVE